MEPKYNIGDIVKVFEFYSEMIVKDVYHGLIVDVDYFPIGADGIFIYNILPNESTTDRRGVQTAEEFAIEELVKQ
jgi:hypothetical protein